jgi:hypothetical protein
MKSPKAHHPHNVDTLILNSSQMPPPFYPSSLTSILINQSLLVCIGLQGKLL